MANKHMTMADLMASLDKKPLTLERGQQVKGTVILVTKKEAILDLGTKNEGVINLNELPESEQDKFALGKEVTAYVLIPETNSGQTIVSLHKESTEAKKISRRPIDPKKWAKFTQAQRSNSKLKGEVLEQNKGGFVVDIEGTRAFMPSSQLSLQVLEQGEVTGKTIEVMVVEVDPGNNRLVVTSRTNPTEEVLKELNSVKDGDLVKATVLGAFPFGVFTKIGNLEGFIRASDVSWDREAEISSLVKVGSELEVKVLSKDLEAGRLNLSLKVLTDDPFESLVGDFQVDDVVSGTVLEVTDTGVRVTLKSSVEGFLPREAMESGKEYLVGTTMNFLVGEIDKRRRQIVLAPFLTSTTGLIYR